MAGLLLAAVLIWWVLRGTDPGVVLANLAGASIPWILGAIVLNVGHIAFRVWRWRALLDPVRASVPFRPMFTAVIVGYMTSWIIPGRVGELVRPMLLAERERLPLGPCVGTIVGDRVLDGVAVLGLFAVGTWIVPLEGQAAEHAALIRSTSITLVVGAVLVIVAMLVAAAASDSLGPWLERRGRLLRWLGRTTLSISSGVQSFRSLRLLVLLIVHSALAWVAIAVATWAMILASGARVPFGAVLVILPMLALGIAVPTPGGVGSYQLLMKVGLMLFGVGESLAASAGILAHLIIVVPMVLLGLILISVDKISWREIVSAARRFRRIGDAPYGAAAEKTAESVP